MIQTIIKRQGLTTPASNSGGINRDLFRQASVLIGCVALFAIFSILTSSFYQPSNLIDIMLQSAINAIIAVGMTLVIYHAGNRSFGRLDRRSLEHGRIGPHEP